MTDREMNNWDRRYDQDEYFYGFEPNHFVRAELEKLPAAGRGLFPAEGEGRNAVFAAGLGHQAVALDNSFVGRRKALEMAAARGVGIEYRLEDLVAAEWETGAYDFAAVCFAHLPPEVMPDVHRRIVASLRPGGRLIHCSFSKAQFGRKSGGPPRLDWLHEVEELKRQYAGIAFDRAVEYERVLDEAGGHRGDAMIIEISGIRESG